MRTSELPTFVVQALGAIDWSQWWTWDDYRVLTNFQIFAKGASAYAGKPPTIQALIAGMDSVFRWVMVSAPSPPAGIQPGDIGYSGDSRAEWAVEAASEVASYMYESGAISNALAALLPKWKATGSLGLSA